MDHRSPSKIPQRVIEWVKTRIQPSGDASGTSSASGESGGLASVRSVAMQVFGHLKDAAGEARTRGKDAFAELQRRRKEQSGSASSDAVPSPEASAERAGVSSSTAGQTGSGTETSLPDHSGIDSQSSQSGQSGREVPASEGDSGSESPSSVDPSSIAWASTAGVIDTDLTSPASFIEAEQSSASTVAQEADPDAGPAERAAETGEDVTAQVAGNAEEGTRIEAATDAQRATTNTPRVESLDQAPDDPIGGLEDRTPGTQFATESTEPYAFGPSGDQGSGDLDEAPTSAESPTGSDHQRPPASGASRGDRQASSSGAPTTRMTSPSPDSSASSRGNETSTSASAPVGDDGLPIYFDSVETSDAGPPDSDEAGSGSSSTALSADAYRSTTAPEEMATGDQGSTGSQRPQPGSTIPDFATDSDSSTRIVESRRGSTDASSQDRGRSPSIVGRDSGDVPPAGVGVPANEPTSRVPGDFEPGSDPASGQARAGTDTHRRGDAGLGGGRVGSSTGRSSFEDVEVSDVTAADPSGEEVAAPDAITQQETAGAVDTSDPEGTSRRIVRDANRQGKSDSPASAPPKGSGSGSTSRRSRTNRRDRGR